MQSLNKLQIIGNVTADPSIKETPSGQKVANFTVATNHEWKDAKWEKQSITEYHSVVAWWKLAEICGYATKGKKVFCEGRVQTRSWEKDGQKMYKAELILSEIILIGGSTGKAVDVSDEFADLPKWKSAKIGDEELNIEW